MHQRSQCDMAPVELAPCVSRAAIATAAYGSGLCTPLFLQVTLACCAQPCSPHLIKQDGHPSSCMSADGIVQLA